MTTPTHLTYAFGQDGDLSEVPDTSAEGSVNLKTGFPAAYDLAPTVNGSKSIQRSDFNNLLYRITNNLKWWQEQTHAPWLSEVASGAGYGIGAIVNYAVDGLNYISNVAANASTPGADTNWTKLEALDLKSVAIANNTSVDNVAFYQTGVSLTAEILRDVTNELTLIAWDTLTTPYVITSYAANDYTGYDVVTDQGTFEFVTCDTKKLREVPNLAGWTNAFNPQVYSTTDISNALTMANDYAHTVEKTLFFPDGWAQVSSGEWELDISKTKWQCDGVCTLYATSNTPDYYLRLFSSLGASQARRNKLFANHMRGIHLVGNSLTGATGIVIGKDGETTEQVDLSYGSVKGFGTLVDFRNNSTWCSNFKRYFFYNGAINASSNQTNSFEREVFDNCFFTLGSGNGFEVNTGDWIFDNCSLDNSQIINNGDARVMMSNIHFEQPNKSGSGYADNSRYIKITSGVGVVQIKNADVLLTTNDATNINYAPFYVDPSNEYAGLSLDSVSFTNTDYFTPEVNDDYRQYVAGGGRVQASNITATGGGHVSLISSYLGLISNQGFETGNANGWDISGTATSAIQSVITNLGNYALESIGVSGNTQTIRAYFDCGSREMLTCLFNYRFTTDGSDSLVSFAVNCYDREDNLLSNTRLSPNLSASTDGWEIGGTRIVTDTGTAYVRVEVYIVSGTANTSFYLDNVIANIS